MPTFTASDLKSILSPLKKNWVSEGPETKIFETNFKNFINVKYATATTSGTSALFLALCCFKLKPKDEVIIPSLTFIATANAVKLAGAKPVLADIDKSTFTISLDSIKEKITNKTKGIIPVHLNGRSSDLNELSEFCKSKNLFLIEDAAQSLGSKFNKKYLGSFGDASAFSFSPPKIITTGQGGIVVTNKLSINNLIKKFKDHGRLNKNDYHSMVGYNFKFTDVLAALGNSQFSQLKSRITKTKQIHNWYIENLKDSKYVKIPFSSSDTHLWYFDILTKKRTSLISYLYKYGIQTRPFYKPLNIHPPYQTKSNFTNSSEISKLGLYLPSSVNLNYEQVEFICKKINSFYD